MQTIGCLLQTVAGMRHGMGEGAHGRRGVVSDVGCTTWDGRTDQSVSPLGHDVACLKVLTVTRTRCETDKATYQLCSGCQQQLGCDKRRMAKGCGDTVFHRGGIEQVRASDS